MRAVGYIRVSTEHQADHGVSLDAQRVKLAAFATAMDLDLVAIVEDAGISAKSLDRPGVKRALAMLDAGEADALLVTKLDRLTRSVRDLADLLDDYFTKRFSLLSVGDSIDTRTAAGRMVLGILTTIGQWEREACAERVREAMAHLKKQGVRLGGAALGWEHDVTTDARGRRVQAPVPEELETLVRIYELRADGLSLREIAATMHDEGRPTKRGGYWAAETVRKVLARSAPLSSGTQPTI